MHQTQKDENMSSDRSDNFEPNSAHRSGDDDDQLEAIVEHLNSKVAMFERNLESAVLAETQFRSNIQTLLNSLDAFVERHVEKDRHLTQLIEEDTQRSKEAKEEYDALASRFDDNVRRDNFTRTRDWLRTVSVYVGIVLSVVLMAPLHALWWLLTRTLERVGFLKSSDETTIYSTERRRRRDMTHKTTSSNRSTAAVRHRRHTSRTNATAFKEGESLVASSSEANHKNETMDDTDTPDARSSKYGNNKRGQEHEIVSNPIRNAGARIDSKELLAVDMRETGPQSRRMEVIHDAGSSGSGEEFFDARNGLEESSAYVRETEAAEIEQVDGEEDDDSATRGNAPLRPGWAVPVGSDQTLPDLSAFPSSEFWEISDDDIRLEIQRSDQASN